MFRERGLWGAISKTNHAILRWRDPIYRSVRELAMTYAHEYCLPGGKKSMLSFSKPFSLARYTPKSWVIAPEDLDWLLVDLDTSPHLPVAPPRALRSRRRASRVEMLSQDVVEWPDPRRKKKKKKRNGTGLTRAWTGRDTGRYKRAMDRLNWRQSAWRRSPTAGN